MQQDFWYTYTHTGLCVTLWPIIFAMGLGVRAAWRRLRPLREGDRYTCPECGHECVLYVTPDAFTGGWALTTNCCDVDICWDKNPA